MTAAAPPSLSVGWSTLIRAEPRTVYAAFATAEGHDGWWTDGATVEPWPGGNIRLPWEAWGPDSASAVMTGTVLEARPGERFCFRWHGGDPATATRVEIGFQAEPRGTVVRVRESGYPDTPAGHALAHHVAAGWGEALTLAKFFVEHGVRY